MRKMTLMATWFSEGRRAQQSARSALSVGRCSTRRAGRPLCEVALQPFVGKWIIKCSVCRILAANGSTPKPLEDGSVKTDGTGDSTVLA
jgi:hypothetical protein